MLFTLFVRTLMRLARDDIPLALVADTENGSRLRQANFATQNRQKQHVAHVTSPLARRDTRNGG